MGRYDDIIDLPHPVSKTHSRMSLEERSAQFAPFAALTGYEEAVEETARLTAERIELDEEEKTILDNKLMIIREQIQSKPVVSITYFVPDSKKDGGSYIAVTGAVKKIDEYKQVVVLEGDREIPIMEIIKIDM